MSSDLIIGAAIGLIFALALYIFTQKRKGSGYLSSDFKDEMHEFFRTATNNANEQLITMAQQKLGAEKQEIKTDLDNKRREFEKLIESVQKELRDNDKTAQSIIQQIKDHEKITKDLSVTTEGLRKVLTNNQLRGQFGEQVAEDLLKMVGFVKGVDYEYNKAQSAQSRPDFSIFLPDKTRINIDVKFPYANLQKATETDDRAQKDQYLKLFAQDVKQKIAQVTTRDYINPEERTVDFVILFVPNEMIFSYIYDKMNDIWKDGMTKKVILAGPFSFTAILRMVRQAYDNFRYQKNIHHIVAHIRDFEKQFELYTEEFSKLGTQLRTVQSTYEKVDSTRTRQLNKVIERIKLDEENVPDVALPDAVAVIAPTSGMDDDDDGVTIQ